MREGHAHEADLATLVAWRWASEDKLIEHARHMSTVFNVGGVHVGRLESAALHGDHDGFMAAAAELLEAVEAS